MTQPLPGPIREATTLVGHYGYAAVAVCALVEGFGVPLPAVTVLVTASAAAATGRLSLTGVIVIAVFAAACGDNIGYALGRAAGMPSLHRWGRYVRLTPARLDRAAAFMIHRGAIIIPLARFIDGFRQSNGLIAGALGMPWLRRYLPLDFLGALLWTGTWSTLGYTAGAHLGTVYTTGRRYSTYAAIAALAILALAIAWRFLRRRHHPAPDLSADDVEPKLDETVDDSHTKAL